MANTQMCRACLATKETFSYFLFENVTREDFSFCTSIEVQENEDLPKTICNACYDLLLKYTKFKRTCIESQNTLHNIKIHFKNEPSKTSFFESILEDAFDDQKYDGIQVYDDLKLENDSLHFADDFVQTEGFTEGTMLNSDIKPSKRKRKNLKNIRGHMKKEVKLKVERKHFLFSCELCRKKFNYRERFEAHKLEHEGKTTTIVCQPCNKIFVTWSGLRRHNECEHTRISLEKLRCKVCGKLSKSRQTLKSHEKIHLTRSLFVCDVCGKGCTSASILKLHLETHRENRERTFTCEQCGKKFFTQSILLAHMSKRHSDRRYICDVCSYPFVDKYNLAKHLLIHEGKKLHKCDVCEKSYAKQSYLLEHKRIHSGERPFNCSYCTKCFVSKKGLNEHTRTHTGERPYKCGVCNHGFSQAGTLKRHLKIHEKIVTTLT